MNDKINDLCDIESNALGDASKSDDMLLSPNASTITDLEAFIDKSFYSASELSDPVQPMDFSAPAQRRSEENLPKLEVQFLTFKENVTTQLQVLSCKLFKQNNTINISKQELCKLTCENLHLKSRISELEGRLSPKNTTNGISDLSLCEKIVKGNTILTANIDACAVSSRLSPETTIYVDDSDEYAISTVNADACAVPSDSPPETSAHADETSAPISQQCGEDNSEDYDKKTLNRTDDIVNSKRTIKSTKQVLNPLSNSTMDNPGEKENIGLASANSIGKCQLNSTSYEQELKTPKTPTRSTNKPRQKPNTRVALQSTNVNNKIRSDLYGVRVETCFHQFFFLFLFISHLLKKYFLLLS